MGKSWKKKLKKVLKVAAPLMMLTALAKGKGKGTAAIGTRAPDFVKGVPKYTHKKDSMSFPNAGISAGVDYHASPFERSKIADKYGLTGKKRWSTDVRDPSNFRNEPVFGMDSSFGGAMAKKGGRIVKTKGGGKALRGLGRAFTKRKK